MFGEQTFAQLRTGLRVSNFALLLFVFMAIKGLRSIRIRKPRTATSTFTQLMCSEAAYVHVQFSITSTETMRLIRDGEPRMSTSTFTQLLSSEINRWKRRIGVYLFAE